VTQEQPAPRFAGVAVPEPEFAGDDGTVQGPLAAVLAAYDDGRASVRDVAQVLATARLMTPVVAVLDEAGESPDGLSQEKSSHMASVSLVAADGRRGLLAFSSVQSMNAWDPAARGIPALGSTVAAGAVEEHADALLLDIAGPVRVAVEGAVLRALAVGGPLPLPYADPSVHSAVVEALAEIEGLAGLVLEAPAPDDDPAPDLVVVVAPVPGTDASDLARAVAERLVAHPAVAAACPRGVAVGIGTPDADLRSRGPDGTRQ
jgi:hypothetical protein